MEIGIKTESPFLLLFAFKGCLPDFPSPSLSVPYPPSRDEQYIPQVIINYMTKTKKACLLGQPVPVITTVMVQ